MAKSPAKSSGKKKTQLRRKFSLDISITGFVFCTMLLFILLAGINTQANLLFGVAGLMIGILMISFMISGLVISKLRVQRLLPDHGVVGQPLLIQYQVTNRKRFWPSLSVSISEFERFDAFVRQPIAYLLHCANHHVAIVPAEVFPNQRGVVTFNRYQLTTSFPFGFVKRAIHRTQKDSLVILPPIGAMRRELIQRFKSAASEGENVRPTSGGTDEFYGLREYRAGENPRWIYWKRSARTGTLAMKEMTRVSPPIVMIILDTRLRSDSDDSIAEVERAIAMAATLIDKCLEAGLSLGLICWDGKITHINPNLGKRHRLDMLTQLARLEYATSSSVDDLVGYSRKIVKPNMTSVLISPQVASMGLATASKGGMVLLSSRAEHYGRYFHFDPAIDFATIHESAEN